ncbi:MAG TPA: DUF3309 domain-containing protein [Pirellulales bacterium]|nr:DUF3309 domain-containing protein [Pirellulales bacterium]
MATLLLIVLVLLVIGAVPAWPYNNGWGYYPSGSIGVLVAIVLLLALFGAIPWNFYNAWNVLLYLHYSAAPKEMGVARRRTLTKERES